MILTKVFEFDASHHLVTASGKSEKLHGHTYKLIVKVQGTIGKEGRVIDFVEFKKIVTENVIKDLKHAYINDIIQPPTTEKLCMWVWNKLVGPLQGENRRLYEIEIWETPKSGATYGLEDANNK